MRRERINKLLTMGWDALELEHLDELDEIAEAIVEIVGPDDSRGEAIFIADAVGEKSRNAAVSDRKEMGRTIRHLRESKGMTQEELAAAAGIPQSHVSRQECGNHAPTPKTIERIAEAFGVPPSEFEFVPHSES